MVMNGASFIFTAWHFHGLAFLRSGIFTIWPRMVLRTPGSDLVVSIYAFVTYDHWEAFSGPGLRESVE
jgi:hypothetical protein